MKKRRQFNREFKLQVIREIESGTPVAQVARQHQIHDSLIHKWRRQYSPTSLYYTYLKSWSGDVQSIG